MTPAAAAHSPDFRWQWGRWRAESYTLRDVPCE